MFFYQGKTLVNIKIKNKWYVVIFLLVSVLFGIVSAQEFEFENNFLMNLSFKTGTDRGMEQNLDDNFLWMQEQGYTHLRFFGIFPNGYHCFPSPTLDANGFPNHTYLESTLALLVPKANQYGITVNFDGWEVLAESNYDTTLLGVSFITENELAAVVAEVLAFGVNLVTEEQFGAGYMTAIQSVTEQAGAVHETTSLLWWPEHDVADAFLSNVFAFYPYDQAEADLLIGNTCPVCNLGLIHWAAESAHFFGIPFSLAVGSFGNLEVENWRNVLLFAQLQHQPERFSIEETRTDFTIWNPEFNFMSYVGNDIISYDNQIFAQRPIMNLVFDIGVVPGTDVAPAVYAGLINGPAVANTAGLLGYRPVATVDTVLPEAEAYYLVLGGGPTAEQTIELPSYILPLLGDDRPVFFQPVYGLPAADGSLEWGQLREYFGVPVGPTQTLEYLVPETVNFDNEPVKWGGVIIYLAPRIERLLSADVDTLDAMVILSDTVNSENLALLIQRGNKFLVNSNLIHLEVSYILSNILNGPLNTPAAADIAISDTMVIIFAEHDTYIDLNLPWESPTHIIYRNAVGEVIQDSHLELNDKYEASMLRGELVILTGQAAVSCCLGVTGNVDCSEEEEPDISDITRLIDYLYLSHGELCCPEEADVDVSGGEPDISDITRLIDHLYLSHAPLDNCP